MNGKSLCLVFSLLVLTGVAASADNDYTHNQNLYFGESMSINDYVIDYKSDNNGDQFLRIGEWTGASFHVIEQFEEMGVYEAEGEKINVSESMSMIIEGTGYDRDGRFVNLSISASKDVFSSGDMTSSVPDKIIISQGESAQVPLTLENTGYLNQTYSMGYETNSSLTASFSYQDFNVTNVYVPADEEESVTATVEVPDTAELGTYDFRITAENSTKFSEDLQVEVRGAEVERQISLDMEQSYTQTQSGTEIRLPMRVRNEGGGIGYRRSEGVNLNNIEFDITVPNDWEYSLNPKAINTLESYESQRVILNVDVPESAQPGDFFIEASVSSEKASLDQPKEVRVNVFEQSDMGIVGAILMAISLGMLIFVYRKFGRR